VAQWPIGVDIGTTAVRMVQLAGRLRDLRLVDAAKFVVPREAAADPDSRRQCLVDGIARLLKRKGFRGREVVMALAPEQVAVRNVRLPEMPPEELGPAVRWEVQNRFPFDTATAVVQWIRAGRVRQGGEELDEIIVLAAPRAEVDGLIDLAAHAGATLVSLDAAPCALFRGVERFLQRQEDERTVTVLVDLGARTTVVIAVGREIVFLKTVPIGGTLFNQAVAERLELEPLEAEALRRRIGDRLAAGEAGPEDGAVRAVADALRPHLEDLADEIGLCLRYYGVTFRGPRPEVIQFTGGEAHQPQIPHMLGERLAIGVEVVDPFRGLRIDHLGTVLDRRGVRAEWATAFGLALKGLVLEDQLVPHCAA